MNGKRLGEWVIRFRWLIIVSTLGLALAAGSGGRFLGFSTDYRVFFGKDNPQLQAFERLQDTYTKNDNVLFAIAPDDGKVFTRETLSLVEDLTKDAWQIPYSLRVDSITNFQHTWADGDELIVEDLVKNAASLSSFDLDRIKTVALSEPLLLNRNISPSGDVTGVNVTISLPGKSMDEVPEVVAFVREMARKIETEHPEIKVYLSGMVMMNNSFSEASQDDMSTLMPLMYLVLIISLGIMLRSFSGAFAAVMVIGLSALTAIGLAGWSGILFTPPSASAPTIILTLAVADSVHFLVTMFQEMRRGKSKRDAIIESMRINLLPIFLTSLTTTIGFLSMNTSDSPPFHDLGNMVAMGVIAAFFYSIFFLPAMMSVLPVWAKNHKKNSKFFMDHLGDFVVNRRQPLFWGMLAITFLFISSVPLNRFNDQFVNYFDDRYSFRTDTDFIVDHLTGIYLIEYSLDSGEEGGVSNPEYLKTLEAFGEWYKQQTNVLHVSSLTVVMKRLNQNMHGDDPAYYRIPENRELSAQYLLLYEMSLPYGLDLNNQINVKKSATRFSVTLENVSTTEMLALEERAQQWLQENASPSMQVPGASTTIMFSHISERNINSMMFGTALALLLISGILIVSLRNIKIGFLSIIPNLVPAGMAFGFWGLMVGEIGVGTSIVVGMSLGIVVDDTVHFLSKYLRAKREHGMNSQDAVRYAFHNVGSALWVTSFVLGVGFSVLTFSGFSMNAEMGLLTAITIAFALAADFLLLPPLLMTMEGAQPKEARSPMTKPGTEGVV
ncbi:MAG: RND family transporter [Nitrospiria bacterium]